MASWRKFILFHHQKRIFASHLFFHACRRHLACSRPMTFVYLPVNVMPIIFIKFNCFSLFFFPSSICRQSFRITFCGITMKNYVELNISQKSHTTIKYALKMMSSSSETIIFMFLGVATVNNRHDWNTCFIVLTIIFCSVYRTIGKQK